MRPHSLPFRLLSLALVVALMALRLSNFTEQIFVEPVEDAIFDIAFIAAEDGPGNGKPIKVKTKRAMDIVLAPVEVMPQQEFRPILQAMPASLELALKEILREIFIPPETVC